MILDSDKIREDEHKNDTTSLRFSLSFYLGYIKHEKITIFRLQKIEEDLSNLVKGNLFIK